MQNDKQIVDKNTVKAVADYYDKHTTDYLETYGNTIQAFRPLKDEDLHNYILKNSGIKAGMTILDAGCGVAGPASYFAANMEVDILGITISPLQAELATKLVRNKKLKGRIDIKTGDFHSMSDIVQDKMFDRVLFLESLGHSNDPDKAIKQAYKVLKPGGAIYIKDFFPFDIANKVEAEKYKYVVSKINEAYTYNVLDLYQVISSLRRTGFEIVFIKKLEFQDDITVRAAFEERLSIDLFGGLEEFRVAEWLEILCYK